MILKGGSCGGATATVDEYIIEFCVLWSRKSSNQVLIWDVKDLPLKIFLFCIMRVARSTQPHLSS